MTMISISLPRDAWWEILQALYEHKAFDQPWEFTDHYVEAFIDSVQTIEKAIA